MTLETLAIIVICLTLCSAQNVPFGSTPLPTNDTTLPSPSSTLPQEAEIKNEETLPPILPTNDDEYNDNEDTTVPQTISPSPPKKKPYNTCSDIENGDSYTQAEFLDLLTNPCRYDKLTRPEKRIGDTVFGQRDGPVNVHVQIDIRHIEAAEQLQFKMHMLLQYRYRDPRLNYEDRSPHRSRIVGEDLLRSKVWVPHVLLENEKDSSIMGHDARDIYMSIDPSGEVTYSRRIKATLYCWMDLKKFPFDEQVCDIGFLSWTYNASEMMLHWEAEEPVVVANQLHLTEYSLIRHWTEESIKQASRQTKGAFTGNYSCLTFKFQMAREMGFYMLDYFIPSIMLVCISWVSFWLQADASAPRITIGTSTMLSFITLATAQTRTLPKVSYIKASEIWFLACTMFIFGSMVEFAFVNIIWRRKSNVELKKVNSKYILKCTLTPRLARKELLKGATGLHKSHSCSSLVNVNSNASTRPPQYNNYLTVHSFNTDVKLPKITTESVDDLVITDKKSDCVSINMSDSGDTQFNQSQMNGWTTMTPQEISQWIDRRSRLVFPCAFVIFNAFYWCFVYWL